MNKHPEIPKGLYCYTINSVDKTTGKLSITVCPYWSKNPNKSEQENGYCSFLKKGDWEIAGGLLWDSCKECGINTGAD